MALFESYERRIDQINAELAKHGISSIEEAKQICDDKGIDVVGLEPVKYDAVQLINTNSCEVGSSLSSVE